MVFVLPKTYYCCNVCYCYYDTIEEAIACERLNMPVDELKHTDEIFFTDERGGGGSHYIYDTLKGKILFRHIVKMDNAHYWFYLVKTEYTKEHGVALIPDRNGWVSYMSQLEWKYKIGNAAIREQEFKEIEERAKVRIC
jgi:hypothetical protein